MNKATNDRATILYICAVAAPFVLFAIGSWMMIGFQKTLLAFAIVAGITFFSFKVIQLSGQKAKKDKASRRMKEDIYRGRREV